MPGRGRRIASKMCLQMAGPDIPRTRDPAPLPPWWLRALARLPMPVLYTLCGALANCARVLVRTRWRITCANLRATYPAMTAQQVRQLACANYRHFGELAAELIASCRMTRDELVARVRIEDVQLLRDWLGRGRPVLL